MLEGQGGRKWSRSAPLGELWELLYVVQKWGLAELMSPLLITLQGNAIFISLQA